MTTSKRTPLIFSSVKVGTFPDPVTADTPSEAETAPVDEAALVAEVYADTPKQLHAMALRSLRAHLHKLQAEGRASRRGDQWQLSA